MNKMMTELILRIYGDGEKQLACTTILFGEEPLKPIPAVGDSITLAVSKTTCRGIVFARAFDYSVVDEHDETAPLRISIDARVAAQEGSDAGIAAVLGEPK
jgi:hypothetical protein